MAFQIEDFHNSIPNHLPLKQFRNRHTFDVPSLSSMQFVDHTSQFSNVVQAVASTKSPTLQNDPVTPAAIAGVQRRVLWRLTKL